MFCYNRSSIKMKTTKLIVKSFYVFIYRERCSSLIILTRTTCRQFLIGAKSFHSPPTNGSSTRIRNGSRPSTKTTTSTTWRESTIPSSERSSLNEESSETQINQISESYLLTKRTNYWFQKGRSDGNESLDPKQWRSLYSLPQNPIARFCQISC